MRLPENMVARLRDPSPPHGPLTDIPMRGGVAVLINEANSVFRLSDFEDNKVTTMDLRDDAVRRPSLYRRLRDDLVNGPLCLSYDISDFPGAAALAEIARLKPGADVLVIGAGEAFHDAGLDLNIVYTDVAIGKLTMLVADAHDIPFIDDTFDAVIAEAVLEHVADPQRCVSEIERVLKPGGWVYSVTPFMQPVHMGAYDFTRFTAVGHRRLFRRFDSEREGMACGPGSALAWSLEYWMGSFTDRASLRPILGLIARLIAFPIKHSDRILKKRRSAIDGGCGFYFFGRMREESLSDREIVATYAGAQG